MFDSLDVLIGLVTVYLALAFACTAMVEGIAAWTEKRGKTLKKGLEEFLAGDLTAGKPFIDEFYKHPLVWSLSQGKQLPSYLPSKVVGQVVEELVMANGAVTRTGDTTDDTLLDVVRNPPVDTDEEAYVKGLFGGLLRNVIGEAAVLRTKSSVRSLYQGVENLPGGSENQVKGVLTALLNQANGDPVRFRVAVEEHFNLVMDRASGWFKRHQQLVALGVSAFFVVGGNVDTFSIASSLSQDKGMRESMVSYASEILKKDASKLTDKSPIISDNPIKDALGQSAEALTALHHVGGLQFGWATRDFSIRKMDTEVPHGKGSGGSKNDTAGVKAPTAVVQRDSEPLDWLTGSTSTDISGRKMDAAIPDHEDVGGSKNVNAEVKAPTVVEQRDTEHFNWLTKLVGLLITTFAVSLGAPFWFDLLKRFMQVREAGKRPPKPAEPEEVCKPE
jgi:hypothetical protein